MGRRLPSLATSDIVPPSLDVIVAAAEEEASRRWREANQPPVPTPVVLSLPSIQVCERGSEPVAVSVSLAPVRMQKGEESKCPVPSRPVFEF